MMNKYFPKTKSILLIALFGFFAQDSFAQISISLNHEDGIYEIGETLSWQIEIDSIEKYDSIRYEIKPGGLEVLESGMLEILDAKAELSYHFQKAESVILVIRWGTDNSWFKKVVSGALSAPQNFYLSSEKPKDFEAFWEEKIAELQAIPMNSVLEEEEVDDASVQYSKVQMDNINGTKIQAQMALPAKEGKFPALLVVQWAGVYPLQKDWVLNRAKEGWLVLNINPHDLPIDMEREFYREQSQNDLRQYWAIGNEDRDSSYFLRMYLSCYRGVEFLKNHPSWNGQTLAVTGDSQGGQQTLITAGLHPDITAAMALVPAGFDMLGPRMLRKGGWPQWYRFTEDKDASKVHEASRYFDVANFVSNIKCPVLVGLGIYDETCPPEGILAGMNQLSSNKEIIILQSNHQNRNDSQTPYRTRRDEHWLAKLKEGLNPME